MKKHKKPPKFLVCVGYHEQVKNVGYYSGKGFIFVVRNPYYGFRAEVFRSKNINKCFRVCNFLNNNKTA